MEKHTCTYTHKHTHRVVVCQCNSHHSFLEIKNLCKLPTSWVSVLCQNLFLCLPSREWRLMPQMKPLKLGSLNGNRHLPFQIKAKCLSDNWKLTSFCNFQGVCKMKCELKEMLWKHFFLAKKELQEISLLLLKFLKHESFNLKIKSIMSQSLLSLSHDTNFHVQMYFIIFK